MASGYKVALIMLMPSSINFTKVLWAQVIVYLMAHLMVICSLQVIYDTPCILSLTSWTMLLWMLQNDVYWKHSMLLIVLMHETIQAVYCYYMLTPSMECLWYVKFWHLCFKLLWSMDRMNDQMTSYGAEGKHLSVQWIHI